MESHAHIDFLRDMQSYRFNDGPALNEELSERWASWMIYF